MADSIYSDEYKEKYQIHPNFLANNIADKDENPTGGGVNSIGLNIGWQDGPRGKDRLGNLQAPNGAFVEDVIYAALQRLDFFQQSKFKHEGNAKAIEHLQGALDALKSRADERKKAGTIGSHKV